MLKATRISSKEIEELTKENKKILFKMTIYLYTFGLSKTEFQATIKELQGMALEAQLRGEDFQTLIGEDFQTFCDELVKEIPKKSLAQKVYSILYGVLTIYLGMWIGLGIATILWEAIYEEKKMGLSNFSIDIAVSLGLIIAPIFVSFYIDKYMFHLIRKVFKLSQKNVIKYLVMFLGMQIIGIITFFAISISLIKFKLFTINSILGAVILLLALLLIIILKLMNNRGENK